MYLKFGAACIFLLFAVEVCQPSAVAQSRQNFCAIAGGPSSLVLVDRTSPYSHDGEDHHGDKIAHGIDALLSSLRGGERLSVATIERNRALSSMVFDDCYPGCDPRARNIIGMPDCPEATVESRRRLFRARLYSAVYPLLNNSVNQPNSDIAGTITQASQQHQYALVYIFSDMLENSAMLPWSAFSTQTARQDFMIARDNGFVPNLHGASIQIVGYGLFFSRKHPSLTAEQDRSIREFWQLYFAAGGATVSYHTEIEP